MNRLPISTPVSERRRFLKQPLAGGSQEVAEIVDAIGAGRCCRLIGPRYHHKSQIMRRACNQVEKQLGYVSLYISMWDAKTTSGVLFLTSIRDLMATKANRYYKRRLPRPVIKTPAELTVFLADLPGLLRANVVLFVDDLEETPAEHLSELLLALRAAYQTTATDLRFLAVVCASHGLARTALGPTSPFENISSLVMVRDLTPEETRDFARQLVTPTRTAPTVNALALIHEQTGGDRTLVSEVCRECCALVAKREHGRITRDVVRSAIDGLVQQGGREVVAEGLQQIENDLDQLRAITVLMRMREAPAADLFLDPSVIPDPLTTSGFVHALHGRYRIKSDLHHRLLARHFSPDRVGRIFHAAGDWERAIYYLGSDIRQSAGGTAEDRARVMLAAVSAMYSVQSKRDAYAYLARGFQTAYPRVTFQLFDLEPGAKALAGVNHPTRSAGGGASERARHIPLSANRRPEIRALANPQEYHLQPVGRQRLTLYVPLRAAAGENLGLAVVDGFVSQSDHRRAQELIVELVGYMRHAARALKNRMEHENLYRTVAQRAKDLGHLLQLTQELMSAKGTYQQVLDHALRTALEALKRNAQMGSIYLYDRQTGWLSMQSHSGFSPEVQAATRFRPGEGLAGYVYATGRSWIVKDTASDRHYADVAPQAHPRVRSTIGVPLLGQHGSLGVLCLDNIRQTNAFDAESEQLLRLLAGQIALWLENIRLLEVLRASRETALLASRLLHEMTGALAGIPDLVEEVAMKVDQWGFADMLQAPVSELNHIAEVVASVGSWLSHFVRVGTISLEPIDLGALIPDTLRRVENRRPAHVRVRELKLEGVLTLVRADRTLISILVENLVENAYDALQEVATGEVALRVRTEGDSCVIRIWDNGSPIAPESRPKIWEPGWSTKSPLPGYGRGLGLTLCRQIVAAHEGTLTLEDDLPAGGVGFVIRLPLTGPRIGLQE